MSATNCQQRIAFIGIAWAMLGIAVILDNALSAWRAWSEIPSAFPISLVGYIPTAAFSLVAVLAGVGCLARKKWARRLTIVASAVLLVYSLIGIVGVIFLLLHIGPDVGISPMLRGFIVILIAVSLSLFTLRTMLSQRGRDAFREYG